MSDFTPLWECERCHKLVPYMCHFCVDCTYDLVGEPPKPFTPQNVALTCYNDRTIDHNTERKTRTDEH